MVGVSGSRTGATKWEEELDYRDSLLYQPGHDSLVQSLTTKEVDRRQVVTFFPSVFSYSLDDRSGVSGPAAIRENWKTQLEDNFHALHASEGLFYHFPEIL